MQPEIFGEGTHFMIPWLERPEIFSVRVKTRSIGSLTSTKGVSLFFPFFFFCASQLLNTISLNYIPFPNIFLSLVSLMFVRFYFFFCWISTLSFE
jgi:hypothetical protein